MHHELKYQSSPVARILIIPSWYPSNKNPLIGNTIREQATLLQQKYDFRVLHGLGHSVNYRTALRKHRWFPKRGTVKLIPADADRHPFPPPVIGFEFIYRSWEEKTIWNLTFDAYGQMLKRSISEGWKPDLIHAHCTEFAGIVASRLAQEFEIPWLLDEHQVFISTGLGGKGKKLRYYVVFLNKKTDEMLNATQQKLLKDELIFELNL